MEWLFVSGLASEPRSRRDVGFNADDWLDALRFRLLVEVYCPIKGTVVGDGDGLLAEFRPLFIKGGIRVRPSRREYSV